MRAFIALNLPPEQRQELHESTAVIREAAPDASWVVANNLHLTLKFLGNVDDAKVQQIRTALGPIGSRHREVELDIGGAGVFPNFRAPRIVWIGVAPDAKLELLYDDVERACDALGFPAEGRAFRPHITLGRLRTPPSGEARRKLEDALRASEVAIRVAVGSIDLMSSVPSRGGSRYSVIAATSLGRER